MSQTTASNTYGYGNESMGVNSKPVASGMDKETIAETIKPFANQTLVAQMDEYKAKLKEAQEKIRQRNDVIGEQAVELRMIKKENEELHKQLKEKEESGANPHFYPIYDVRMYTDGKGNHPTPKWVHDLWDAIYTHSINTLENGAYYIENSTSVAVIYKTLHDSNRIAFQFTGSYEDFCYSWNANVAGRITDKKHANMLTCAGASLKSEYNKNHWKDVSIGTLELNPDLNGEHGKIHGKANVIIKRIMPDIIKLTTG